MKTYVSSISIYLLLLTSIPVYAQKELKINFLDINKAELTRTFEHKEKARVKIENVNRFKYKLTEEKTEEDFNITVPSILSTIKLPSFFTSQVQVKDSQPLSNAVSVTDSATTLQNYFKNKLKDLIKNWRVINEAIEKHNEIVHISQNCEKSFSDIDTEVKTNLASFVGGTKNESIETLSDKMQTLLKGKIELSNLIINDMEELLAAWKAESLNDFRNSQANDAEILVSLNSNLKIQQEKKPMDRTQVNSIEKKVRDQNRKIKEAEEDYTTVVKDNEAILEKAKTLITEINKYKEEGKYFQLVDDIRKVNESNYTYHSETVTMKKDEYRFKIQAKSDQPLACNYSAEQKLEFILRTKGGVKFDFSSGLFTMFGNDDFLGRSYYYKPVNTTQSSIAAADNGKRALLGIGALMHIYKRSPSRLKVGGAMGVSSSLNFDALNFHIGMSFLMGDKDRFCITVGLTAREVDLLDKKYTLDQTYNKADLPENIPTFKMFPKIGYFFSLTYNISRFNK